MKTLKFPSQELFFSSQFQMKKRSYCKKIKTVGLKNYWIFALMLISINSFAQLPSTGVVPANSTLNVINGGLSDNSSIEIINTGTVPLTFCLESSAANQCISNPFEVVIDVAKDSTISIAQLGGISMGAYLNVTNKTANVGTFTYAKIAPPGGGGPNLQCDCRVVPAAWYKGCLPNNPILYSLPCGSVGIGTDRPIRTFDVRGTSSFSNDMSIYGSLNLNKSLLVGNSFYQSSTPDGNIVAQNRIGIGTINPNATLNIQNDRDETGFYLNSVQPNPYRFAAIIDVDNNDTKAFAINNTHSGTQVPKFLILGNGNVQIDGTLKVKEIICKVDVWSDFVFDKNYKMRSLKDLETFISTNHHLPEIPNQEEVKKGVNVIEVQAKLLQKVEELTLYLIEQNKKIEKLEMELKNNSKK